MNEALINRWNKLVSPSDEVYVLGDFSLAFRPVEVFTQRLNGTLYLVPGNHDMVHSYHKKSRKEENRLKWKQKYEECGWTVLPEQTTLEVPGLANFTLCHHPFANISFEGDDKYAKWRPQNNGQYLLHGHCHEKVGKVGRQINVGVDVFNGYPVSLDQIAKIMADPREVINPPKWGQTLLDM